MHTVKQFLVAFLAGSVVTGGALGTLGYFGYRDFAQQKQALLTETKKQAWRLQNLSDSQTRLQEELEGLKSAKAANYDTAMGALIQAKENASIAALYDWGVKALEEKDIPRAYFALSEVHKANPSYKAVAEAYPKAQQAYTQYQKTQQQEQLHGAYAQGLDAQAKGQWAQAQQAYRRALQVQNPYKDAAQRLATVSKQLATRTQTQDLKQRQAWLEATYKLALGHQGSGRYAAARDTYQQIVADAPGYKDAQQRLNVMLAKAPRPTPAPQTATTANCYAQGQIFGRCASDPNRPGCSSLSTQGTPAACKNNADFVKGFQAAAATPGGAPGASLGADPETGADANPRDPNGLLKGLSSLMNQF